MKPLHAIKEEEEEEGWHFPTVKSSQIPTTQTVDIL